MFKPLSMMLIRLRMVAAVLLLAVVGPVLAPAHAQQGPPPDAGPVSYQTFYDALSPYGQWVTDPDYGYAWVPNAGPDFQPYRTNGHWVYTDYGWTWVSSYQWGWGPFHYGRWRYSEVNGWLWLPGYTWGPAWVAWRRSEGYYGWAPLGPPPMSSGVHVSIGFSFSLGDAPVAPARWCFVPAAYVASPVIATYYVAPTQMAVVYNNTTVIRNTYVNNNVVNNVNNTNTTNNNVTHNTTNNGGRQPGSLTTTATTTNGSTAQPTYPAGPERAEVEKATGQTIKPLTISNRATPGTGLQGQSLALYRPEVAAPNRPGRNPGANAAPNPAPQRVVPVAEAVTQARRPENADRGLMRDNAAQHLSSTDPDPIRGARLRQVAAREAQPASTGNLSPGSPNNGPARGNPNNPQPHLSGLSNPTVRPSRQNSPSGPGNANPASPGPTGAQPLPASSNQAPSNPDRPTDRPAPRPNRPDGGGVPAADLEQPRHQNAAPNGPGGPMTRPAPHAPPRPMPAKAPARPRAPHPEEREERGHH